MQLQNKVKLQLKVTIELTGRQTQSRPTDNGQTGFQVKQVQFLKGTHKYLRLTLF